MTGPLLDVQNLSVGFGGRRPVAAVRDLSFQVRPGETVALVGESGSGKSVTALSVMRLIEREGGTVTGGRLMFRRRDGVAADLRTLPEPQMRALRGSEISMIFQEPMTSLNPVLTIGEQVREVLTYHRRIDRRAATEAARALLARVRLTDPDRRLRQYPHELSGGMRQRVMIAIALALSPRLLIADEPTTALDVTIQAGILDLIRELQAETGAAVLFITHDMGVVAELADHVVVMRHGERVEAGPAEAVLNRPAAPYTRALMRAVPRLGTGAPRLAAPASPLVLEVRDLTVRFPVRSGLLHRHTANVHAVEGVSFHVGHGETLGLVGESGSGKSTIGRAVLKLIRPDEGMIAVNGRDVMRLSPAAMLPVRREVQMVFQDPYASLNPRLDVAELVTEPLAIHADLTAAERRERAAALLVRVGLSPDHLDRFPHQFSGGQRQRLSIARALASHPSLIVADEPVSALDVSVQAQVLELMRELQETLGIAFLFISHDLAVVERMSHRVAVLSRGRIVETGPTGAVLGAPAHPYTRALVAAVPSASGVRRRERQPSPVSEPQSPIHPVGTVPAAQQFRSVGPGHVVAEAAAAAMRAA